MAFTVLSYHVDQRGRYFFLRGEAESNAATADTTSILDFSTKIDAQPFGSHGPTYTCTKITTAEINHGSNKSGGLPTLKGFIRIQFGADVNVTAFGFPFGFQDMFVWPASELRTYSFDFRSLPGGGITDPKGADTSNKRGDIIFQRSIQLTGATNDYFQFIISGVLEE